MSKAGNKLKQVIQNSVKNERLTNFHFATMVTPTQIQLDGSQGPIAEICCIIPEFLKTFTVNVEGSFHGEDHSGELKIDNSLKIGDRVIVLQQAGGQKYLVLGRL